MTYNMDWNEDSEDEISMDIDQPPQSYAFSWLDIPGGLLFAAGRAIRTFGDGLVDLGDVLRINAWHERTVRANEEQLQMDRSAFDTIIAQPWPLDEVPREETP